MSERQQGRKLHSSFTTMTTSEGTAGAAPRPFSQQHCPAQLGRAVVEPLCSASQRLTGLGTGQSCRSTGWSPGSGPGSEAWQMARTQRAQLASASPCLVQGGKTRKRCANAGLCSSHWHKQAKRSKAWEAVSPGILLQEQTGLLLFYKAAHLREQLPDAHMTRRPRNLPEPPHQDCLHLPPEREDPVGVRNPPQALSLSIRPSSFLSTADLPLSHLLRKLSVTPLKRLSQVQQGRKSCSVLKG